MTLDSTALEERPDDDVLVPPDRGEPGEAGLDTATAPRDADRREAKDDLTSTGAARERMALAAAIERATRALKAIQHEDGYWCTEFEADCTIPAEYILMMHFTDAVDEALEPRSRCICDASRRARWLVALSRRGARHQRDGQGLLRAQAGRGSTRRTSHAAGPRSRARARRCGAGERVHAHHARAVRADPLARRALHPGRDHPAAEVVSVPPEQGVLLVAYGAGAVDRAVHLEGRARRIPRVSTCASCSSRRPRKSALLPRAIGS